MTIGIGQGVALYVCAILGAGVLVFPGQAASLAGPASLVAWGFSALIGLPLAFTFAALASRFPDAGGVATFASRAFGPAAGGVTGWWYFIAGSVGQTIVPLTAGYYVTAALDVDQRWAPAVAAGVLAVAVAANLAGLRFGARVQIGLAIGVAVILIAVILVALPQIRAAAFTPFAPHGVAGIGRAVVVLFFAFAGWEAIAHLSAEFRDVRRTLPIATLLTVLIVTVLYLGVAFAVVGTGAYGDRTLDRVSLGVIIERGPGFSAVGAVAVAAVVICLGTTNAFVASVSRLGFALGRDGWAPDVLTRRNRHDTPSAAVLAVGAIGGAGLVGAALFGWGTDDIVFIPSVLVLATYLLGTTAAVRLFTGVHRAVAAVALTLLLLTVPFAGRHLLIPAVIALTVAPIHRLHHRTISRTPSP
ncbi:amino acid permease [Actinoplanes sp. NPDC051851]|uniref:APC family permease n=1 Tax=Actinoplanes sp. NPDC051851 TaxID=3154753 RepID=UPI0034346E88